MHIVRERRAVVRLALAGRRRRRPGRSGTWSTEQVDTHSAFVGSFVLRLADLSRCPLHRGARHAVARVGDAEARIVALLAERARELALAARERALALRALAAGAARRVLVDGAVAVVVEAVALLDVDRLRGGARDVATDALVDLTYSVSRQCAAKNRDEVSIALVDAAHDELFVGQVLFDAQRRDRPFVPSVDLPVVRATLQDTYGLPVALRLGKEPRGSLIPLTITLKISEKALPSIPGFVSQDGAALLVGEFHPFGVPPEQWRDALLSGSPGVTPSKGKFSVTAFIDFQCERCRVREPEVRQWVTSGGGAVAIRFLPLVKVHDWSYAAAESAAALSGISPALTHATRRRSFRARAR